MEHKCTNCPLKAKYDQNRRSLVGRLWRWHINFCPGWKNYFRSLSAEQREVLRGKYGFYKYRDK